MSETLWAVIIGGLIAILGSAATQILLFWLNSRKERKERRLKAFELFGSYQVYLDKNEFDKWYPLFDEGFENFSDERIASLIGNLNEKKEVRAAKKRNDSQ